MRLASSKRALILAFSVLLAGSALAQSAPTGRPQATKGFAASITQDIGSIDPSFRFRNASYATGAVGLRNRGEGAIQISGVSTPMKRAFIYWAVVTNGRPTAAEATIRLKRGVAYGAFTDIPGVRIGVGASPCWKGDTTTVFRGNIPLSLANGNGLYLLLLKPGANGSTAGESPWVASDPPLFEGATIVLIGTGSADVLVYDRRLAGKMFYDRFAYALNSPLSVANATEVLVTNIGADGQTGVDRTEIAATAGEITTLNNRRIAGPGSPAGGGDWNGSAAPPLPELWDTTTHNITRAAKAGSRPTVLPFVINAPDDCLVTVANLVSIRNTP